MPQQTERLLRKNTFVYAPSSIAIELATDFLHEAEKRGRIDELMVGGDVKSTIVEDYTDTARRRDALEFQWRPRLGVFPSARTLLTVRPHAPQGTELQFSIVYLPPLGRTGRIFDAVLGRQIAYVTTALLVRRLKGEIERRYRKIRR